MGDAKKNLKWSILVPTVPARRHIRAERLEDLYKQTEPFDDVELIVMEDNRTRTYGEKLQVMIDIAQGEYVNFVDDDDVIAHNYVERLRSEMDGVDCVGFQGEVSVSGGPWKKVFYSVENKEWRDERNGYYRNPQHLTPIRRELVLQIPWVGHYGADRDWSHRMAEAGLIQTENYVNETMYWYYAQPDKNREGVWR